MKTSDDKEQSYFESRMAELGVTEENNLVKLIDREGEQGKRSLTKKIFEPNAEGDILINFWNIEGETINYTDKAGKHRHWGQRRLKVPKGSQKYDMPKGQPTKPFIPWSLVEMYRKSEKVETLYLTEGAFKAYYAAKLGVVVMGLASITCFKNREGKIYEDIRKFVGRCQVQNIVILHDADCRDISLKAVNESLELTERPRLFLMMAEKMRQLIREMKFEKTRQAPSVYYMHPNRGEVEGDPKGLDDLLIAAGKVSEEYQTKVLEDLRDPDRKGKFFFRMDISSTTLHLGGHFCLRKKDKELFYALHAEKIKHRQFYFYGNLYTFINATDGLELITPEWADGVIWVGNDFFLRRQVPSAKEGMSRYKLLPRKKEILASVLKDKNFVDYLPYYTEFVNKPDHFNYQAVIELDGNKFYNRYFPFEHTPEKGPYDSILGFIKHIFGTTMVQHPVSKRMLPRWEMGLDYLQILLQNPTQMLPVLCLYSAENNTGKSTFCKLLSRIFRNNAIFVSNSDLQSDFNSVFVDKLIVMCEETLLERRKDTEKIKNLSTADEITVNEKNVSQYTLDFFTKFIFCSNHEKMIYLTSHDERFWIVQVPRAAKDNPNLLEDMTEEIPAFLHFLRDRELTTEKEGRMWFLSSMIKTENFYRTVEVNEPGDVSNIRHGMRELFDVAGDDCQEILMPMKNIKEEFFSKGASDKWVIEILRDYLGVIQPREADGRVKCVRGSYVKLKESYVEENIYEDQEIVKKWTGRPYVFHRATFFPEEAED